MFNVPLHVVELTSAKLHLQPGHPLCITRQSIESCFPTYKCYNDLHPVVSNFDNYISLGIPGTPRPHPYYINKDTVLRTHMSAHQVQTFNQSDRYLSTGDVYRRDEIDCTHYHIFHQLEGARYWDRQELPDGDAVKAIYEDLAKLPKSNLKVEDIVEPNFQPKLDSPLFANNSAAEIEALVAHGKRCV